ncbi:MAG: tetratricopeptide repeat protein [Planctomycetes bacterium]|nr:tetratricopeptide repeat protein [Planctomycetota bacterium]
MDNFTGLLQSALSHHQAGDLVTAEDYYNKILKIQPDHVETLFLLGTLNLQSGNLEKASDLLRKTLALKPDYSMAHGNLGTSLQGLGKLEEATVSYQKALTLDPGYAEGYYNLANTLNMMGKPDEAISNHRHAIALKPDYAEAYDNLGTLLQDRGKLEEAIENYNKALTLKPGYVVAYNNLGNALKKQSRHDEAVANYVRGLTIEPDNAIIYCNLGTALQEQGKLDEAIENYRKALALKPDHADTHSNLGAALQEQGKPQEAIASSSRAIALKPDFAMAHLNRAIALLLSGNFQDGWQEYEWRLRTGNRNHRNALKPRWNGAPLNRRPILVYAEQGFGDTIQFVRYLPMVRALGGNVIFECPQALVRLLKWCDGIDKIVDQNVSLELPENFDTHVPLLSLPGIFGTTLDTIPSREPYIQVNPGLSSKWRNICGNEKSFKVGLVWAGGPSRNYVYRNRSFTLSDFYPLAEIPGVTFYALQKGPAASEASNPPGRMTIHNLDAKLRDFADTAAVIDNLDLVISVDTAVAHLAGALGKPVWTLLPFSPDWRWMLKREDSPWYPSMRLFRQAHRNGWKEVIECVKDALIKEVEGFREKHSEMLLAREPDAVDASYQKVLEFQPEQVSAKILLSTVNLQNGNLGKAHTLISEALSLKPDYADAYNIQGAIFQKEGRFAEAVESYKNALKLGAEQAEIYNNLGSALIELELTDEAVTNYKHAIALKPTYAAAYYNLANVLKRESNLDEAVTNYMKAIKLDPDYVYAHNNLGVTLKELGRYVEAMESLLKAVSLSPNHSEAHNNCGIVLQEQGNFNDALTAFKKAIASRSDYEDARFNMSMLLLLTGSFTEAWPEYERRLHTKAYGLRTFEQPKWDGSPLNGKRILVHSEQGLGDTIQFVRYLPLVQSRGGHVIFECWPQLLRLLDNCSGINKIIETTTSDEPFEEFDCHIPLMSLPGIFDTGLETIPSGVPYIVADPGLVGNWHKRFSGNNYFKIGLVWSGNPKNRKIHFKKSCTLSAFSPLSRISGLQLYSLQKGPASVETLDPPEGMDIINLEEELRDFSDTAAVIVNLDLVISVDTAVAHLAGALGKPVWTILPSSPDWRWLLRRNDSPWYPGMRLFRQAHPGDWDGVVDRVGQALTQKMTGFNYTRTGAESPAGIFNIDHYRKPFDDSDMITVTGKTPASSHRFQAEELVLHKTTISLCMIVKDEERNLTRCLGSIASLVDEMIIVDTGSRDRTVEIAKEYGAKVYHHPWENNFSKARNHSLSYATSEWILIMDADEELNKPGISRLRELVEDTRHSAISLVVKNRSKNSHNESYTNSIRLFRNFQGTHYDGIVHNVLVFGGECLESSTSITHYGYNLSEEEMEKKYLRTSELLIKQVSTDPCNPVPHRYLGILYLENSNHLQAIKESALALEFAKSKNYNMRDFLISYYVISAASYESGKLEDAESCAKKLIGLDNGYLDGFCILSFVYNKLKQYDNFLTTSEKYLGLWDEITKEPEKHNSVTFHTIGHKWNIHLLRGFYYLSNSQIPEGNAEIDKAVAATNDIKDCLALTGDFYMENNFIDKAEETYLKLLDMSTPSADTLFRIGQIKAKKGAFVEAISFWRKAVNTDPSMFDVWLLICKINLVSGNFEEILTDCDQLLKALNLPRDMTLGCIGDIGDIFDTIGNSLYERDNIKSAETAFNISSELKRIQCSGEDIFYKDPAVNIL